MKKTVESLEPFPKQERNNEESDKSHFFLIFFVDPEHNSPPSNSILSQPFFFFNKITVGEKIQLLQFVAFYVDFRQTPIK